VFLVGNNIVGGRVKLARTRRKARMTQRELAEKLQLQGWDADRVVVAKIEVGIRQVTDKELVKLAKALAVSVSWLIGEIKQTS
jgi:transcriptional regulator with XRE-family HTH domain